MIRRLVCMLAALVLALTGAAEPACAGVEENIAAAIENYEGELIRLHVVAESDSVEDQQLKLKVRDAVLKTAQKLLEDCPDARIAYARLTAGLNELEKAAAECAEAGGFMGSVRAETGVFAFPDRMYGNVLVPAGEYRALRVVIGRGEGHNWWCVLYPGLCLPTEEPRYSILLQWFRAIFGGEGA